MKVYALVAKENGSVVGVTEIAADSIEDAKAYMQKDFPNATIELMNIT